MESTGYYRSHYFNTETQDGICVMGPESTGYEMHSLSDFTIDTTGKVLLEMTKKSYVLKNLILSHRNVWYNSLSEKLTTLGRQVASHSWKIQDMQIKTITHYVLVD